MKRKLVRQGSATMMISLPSKWIKENNLDKGSEVNIEEKDNNILVAVNKTEKKKETTIKLTGLAESSIRILIANTYRLGYDKINVEFENNIQFEILRNTIEKHLIGFEIIKKHQNSCLVENVTEPSIDQFENILDKIFLNITELFAITKKRMEGESQDDFESISTSIQKYDNFCRRIITKQKLSDNKPEMFWNFLSSVVRGQREIYFADKIIDNKTKISPKTKDLLHGCQNIFNLIMSSYKEKKVDKLKDVHKMEKKLMDDAYIILESSKGKENIIIFRISSSIRQFYLASSPLAGLVM